MIRGRFGGIWRGRWNSGGCVYVGRMKEQKMPTKLDPITPGEILLRVPWTQASKAPFAVRATSATTPRRW